MAETTEALARPPVSDIHRSMAKGAGWMVLMRLSIRLIGLTSMVILARLLVPEDFGLVALATVLLAAFTVISEFNFDVVLIQNQKAERAHYDTAWTLGIIRNTVLAGLLAGSGGLAAEFFREPRLVEIVRWLAVAMFIEGFQNIGIVDLRKNLMFHKDFLFMVSNKLAGFFTTLILALLWRDYWALVGGLLSVAISRTLISYAMVPYRPRLSLEKSREILGFSSWLLVSNMISFAFLRGDTFVLGRFASAQVLGLYNIAFELANLATTELVAPIRRAILPGYAKLAEDPGALRATFVENLALILMIATPIALSLGILADPIVHIVLGVKWAAAVPLMQILTIYGVINIGYANTVPVYYAIGRPSLNALVVALGVVVMIPALIWGARESGPEGVAWAVTGASGFTLCISIGLVMRVLHVSVGTIARAIWRTVAAAAATGWAGYSAVEWWPARDGIMEHGALLLACGTLCATVYTGVHFLLWFMSDRPEGAEAQVIGAARMLIGKIQRKGAAQA